MHSDSINHGSEQYHDQLSPSSCVLLLNGYPGVGKLTMAKALEANLKLDDIPYRLIDNRLLIDPVTAIEPTRNRAHYAIRTSFRKTAFEWLKAMKEEGLVIIFTTTLSISYLPTPYDDLDQFVGYVDVAEAKGVPLVVFNIVCDLGIDCERLSSAERKKLSGKAKLVDVDILERLRRDTSVLDWEQARACGKEGHVFFLELDTSELVVEQAAQKVWEFLFEVAAEIRG